jgi:CheY-like chemotaxis protein
MLARGVAHDVNNLSGIILGHCSELRSSASDSPEIEMALTSIEDAAEKSSHLVRRLLAFMQGTHAAPEVLNLNPMVCHALIVEEQELAPDVRIKRFNDPDLWNVAANPNLINEIVLTLSINALKAVGNEGRVTLTTQNIDLDADSARPLRGLKEGPHVLFSVEDTGEGMGPEELAHVFDPATKTGTPGRDQGMSQIYRTVKDHNGHIAVRSEPGIGTTVDLYLPAIPPRAASSGAAAGNGLRGQETVLVIDDEPMIVNTTKIILEDMGYTILTASDGEEGVQVAKTYGGDIHMALLDMAMPGMGGSEAYPLLMKARPSLRIVVMSGFDLGELRPSLEAAGVRGLLQKPFRRDDLIQTVRGTLDAN